VTQTEDTNSCGRTERQTRAGTSCQKQSLLQFARYDIMLPPSVLLANWPIHYR